MADPDFSFTEDKARRKAVDKIKSDIADHRRRLVTSPDPNAPRKMPWKVKSGAELPPRWTITREDGKPTKFVENYAPKEPGFIPHANGPQPDSIFILKVRVACGIGGGDVSEVGDLITAYAGTAIALFNNCEIIEEIRPK